MVSYEGLFFDDEYEKLIFSLEGKHLGIVNDKLHCTFKYRPTEDEIFNDIAGEDFELCIVGYGNDGKNSAFKVILPIGLGIWFIISSILKLCLVFYTKEEGFGYFLLTLLLVIASIICGVILLMNPITSAVIITFTVGLLIVIYSITDLTEAIISKFVGIVLRAS